MALRSGQLVMIADTCNDHQLSIDAYINAHQVRTVLASCIAVQGRTIGLIYLENHIAKNVFTASRIRITEALAAQAGIALENSRLYQQIQDSLQTQTQLTAANQRFVPEEMLSGLGYKSIVCSGQLKPDTLI